MLDKLLCCAHSTVLVNFFGVPACSPTRPLTSVGLPELLHAVPHQDDARQLGEGLDDVEVAQRAHLEEGHAVLLCVRPRLFGGNLPFEGQMQAVTDEYSRYAWSMLGRKNQMDDRINAC